jgi:hypothetical protein
MAAEDAMPSYERLVNRRIDTFLKVRNASGSGELDDP